MKKYNNTWMQYGQGNSENHVRLLCLLFILHIVQSLHESRRTIVDGKVFNVMSVTLRIRKAQHDVLLS